MMVRKAFNMMERAGLEPLNILISVQYTTYIVEFGQTNFCTIRVIFFMCDSIYDSKILSYLKSCVCF